jgi:hypothetical protein
MGNAADDLGRKHVVGHSLNATRAGDLAVILLQVVDSKDTVKNVTEMAKAGGLSVRALQRRCAAAGTTAKHALDFVRCLRVVIDRNSEWSTSNLFPDLDPRTSARLIQDGCLSARPRPTATEFIVRQSFLTSANLKRRLAHLCNC